MPRFHHFTRGFDLKPQIGNQNQEEQNKKGHQQGVCKKPQGPFKSLGPFMMLHQGRVIVIPEYIRRAQPSLAEFNFVLSHHT
jgi:hypothetical protein